MAAPESFLPPAPGADPLAPLRAVLARRPQSPACALRWVGTTGSTNADLLLAAKSG